MKLNPAEYVIKVFGGVRATARVLGKSPSNISRWQTYDPKTINKGSIPTSMHQKILARAKELDLDITPHDLIYGREESKD